MSSIPIKASITALVGAALVTLLLSIATASADQPADLHCPGHQTAVKDSSGADDNDLVLSAGISFCVKAGPGNTGPLIADGTSTLCDYLEDAGIVGGDDKCRDVSYWVRYDTPTASPQPTGSPTAPTPNVPTPTPGGPTPTGSPGPTQPVASSVTQAPQVLGESAGPRLPAAAPATGGRPN